MAYIPCRDRKFPFRLSLESFYKEYFRWLRHLIERLGLQHTRSIWENAFRNYDDKELMRILCQDWQELISDDGLRIAVSIDEIPDEMLAETGSISSGIEARRIIDHTPPIPQIKQRFEMQVIEKEITAYEALYLRSDGVACLAEALIEQHGKQGELIIYDLVTEGRLAHASGETGSVEEFIEYFAATPEVPSLIAAGLESELKVKTEREVVSHVRECEWARFYQENHPQVGYLMACSTDEVAYRAFNPALRLQRTGTIMEGSDRCDFRIFAVTERPTARR